MARLIIPLCALEFDTQGDTIWIHNEQGMTILRIKTMDRIVVQGGCTNPVAHSDIITNQPIVFCMPDGSMTDEDESNGE